MSWLYTVTKNECLMHYRKNRNNINIDDLYDIKEEVSDIDDIVDKEYFNTLISGLSEKEKQIISLKIISKMKFREIAKIMGMPIGTVQWTYYKITNSLKTTIVSLAGTVITFILGIGAMKKEKTKNVESKTNTHNASENKSVNLDAIMGESKIFNESAQQISSNADNLKFVGNVKSENIWFYVSGVFLIISIIFGIFYKKCQQKRRKKSSK